jgi:hypothetical protein
VTKGAAAVEEPQLFPTLILVRMFIGAVAEPSESRKSRNLSWYRGTRALEEIVDRLRDPLSMGLGRPVSRILLPSPHLESSSYELLAQSGSSFESSQLDEIQHGLKELSRCEIQNSVAMLEVCWD